MNVKEQLNIEFQIKSIEILNSTLNNPRQPLPQKVEYQYDINLEHRLNLETGDIVIICTVSIFNQNKSLMLGQLIASCIFNVKDLKSIARKVPDKIQLPTQFLITLNSISVSTMRGLLFSTFKGTFLHNAILPVIDPTSFKMESNKSEGVPNGI